MNEQANASPCNTDQCKTSLTRIAALLALLSSPLSQAQPAQIPLELAPAVEPNAIILLDSSGSMSRTESAGNSRMSVAKTALREIIDSSEHIRFCLSNFNVETDEHGNDIDSGAELHLNATTLCSSDEAHLTFLKNAIGVPGINNPNDPNSGILIGGYTPLAEAFYDISEAFSGDPAHFGIPDTASSISSPIEYRCQSNNVIIVSDGEATYDWDSSGWHTYSDPNTYDASITSRLPDWDGIDGEYNEFFDKPTHIADNDVNADQYRYKHPITGASLAGETAYLGVTPYPRFSDGWLGDDPNLNDNTLVSTLLGNYKFIDWVSFRKHRTLFAEGSTYGVTEQQKGPPYNQNYWKTKHQNTTPPIYCPPGNQPCVPDDEGLNPYFAARITDNSGTSDIKEPTTAQSARIYIDDLAKYGFEHDLRDANDGKTTEVTGGSFDGEDTDADGNPILDGDGNQTTRYELQNLITHTIGLDIGTVSNNSGGSKTIRDLAGVQGLKDAAYYGGGQYHSASSANTGSNTLKEALLQSILGLASGTGSGGSSAASSAFLRTNEEGEVQAFIYTNEYNSDKWSGNLNKIQIIEGDDGLEFETQWQAFNEMPIPNNRNIISHGWDFSDPDDIVDRTFPFQWVTGNNATQNLMPSQIALLGGQNDNEHAAYINYLRGSKDHEDTGLNLRSRKREGELRAPLGDIVHSSITYVKDGNYGYPEEDYLSYVEDKASRSGLLLVGANDGMLHAFNDNTGVEQFAFIPDAVYPRLSQLWRPSYLHRFYVDGKPVVTDAKINNQWKTLYASSLGAGGKALFLLDISNPTSNYDKLYKWEASSDTVYCSSKGQLLPKDHCDDVGSDGYGDLGYTLSEPVIIRTKDEDGDEKWSMITGNGVQSKDGRAVIYVIDLESGRPQAITLDDTAYDNLKKGNGITSINAVDTNRDSYVDRLYAGDLKGNLWRLDLNTATNQFETVFGSVAEPDPLFTAKRAVTTTNEKNQFGLESTATDYRQPIMSGLTVSNGPGNSVMVFFGTGRYYDVEDLFPEQALRRQSFYAIQDNTPQQPSDNIEGPVVDLDDLIEQTVSSVEVDNTKYRNFSSNQVDYDSKKGWYINLPDYGERVLLKPTTLFDRIMLVSQTPNRHQSPPEFDPESTGDYCQTGSRGYLMIVDQQQGTPAFPLSSGSTNVGGVESSGSALSRPIVIQTDGKVNILNSTASGGILVNELNLSYKKTSWRILQ